MAFARPASPGAAGRTEGRWRSRSATAVGSPRRGRSRAERLRAERDRRRRRTTRGILVSVCIGVVVAAVFAGSRMWHSLSARKPTSPATATGSGDPGASRRLDHGDRRDAAQTGRRPDRQSVHRRRGRQRGDFGDPARLLPAAHRASGGHGGQGARRSREPSRQGGHPRGRAARRHHRRQDQRHHTWHLHHDRQRQLRRAERGQALHRSGRFAHSGRKDPAGITFRAVVGRRIGHGDG